MERRDFLNYIKGLSSLVCLSSTAKAFAKSPIGAIKAQFGFNLSLDGFFAQESSEQLRGYKLAIHHINNGGGLVSKAYFPHLKGAGLLSQPANYVIRNSGGSYNSAHSSSKSLVEFNEIKVVLGGSSSEEALAHRKVAKENKIICMDGVSHSDACSIIQKDDNGFSLFLDNSRSAQLISKALEKSIQGLQNVFHIYADYEWSKNQMSAFNKEFKSRGWQSVGTHLAKSSIEVDQLPLEEVRPTVLVLNLYGQKLVEAIREINSSDKIKKYIKDNNVKVVVPLLTSLIASELGHKNLKGIYATLQWDPVLVKDKASSAFVDSYKSFYGAQPSEAAFTGYLQLLAYSNAVSAVESYDAEKVKKFLKEKSNKLFSYDRETQRSSLYGLAVVSNGEKFVLSS